MKSKFLFPTWFNIIGCIMVIPGFVLGYLYIFSDYEIPGFGFKLRVKAELFSPVFENFTNELAIFLVIIGLILIAFSREKKEDELTANLRLISLYIAVTVYYLLYLVGLVFSSFFGEMPFVGDHLNETNIFTPLVIFILSYKYLRHIKKDSFILVNLKLLANKPFRLIGKILAIVCFLLLIIDTVFKPDLDWLNNIMMEIYISFILGLLMWSFSKEKNEDERTMQMRLESLQLAVYFNYTSLLLATLIIYSFNYFYVLLGAQFSLLFFFIIRMEFINYKNNKQINTFAEGMGDEK